MILRSFSSDQIQASHLGNSRRNSREEQEYTSIPTKNILAPTKSPKNKVLLSFESKPQDIKKTMELLSRRGSGLEGRRESQGSQKGKKEVNNL